ncbi:hypothetical protein Daus18300_009302 [Diaporthe australafricana]|uniref:Rhodopsin domain-containing protein n=1 Tax=Diaporthe australafricana TaxID=127596 RepID=A0ABR3WEJ6_9PEZI
MPLPQIWKLQMSRTRRIQLAAVFLLGSLVVGAGIARCVLSASGVTSQSTDLDYTYSRAPAVYWTVIEANVGVISACLPTLRPLLAPLKFADIGSSLRKALYWRTSAPKSSQASSTPWSSDDTQNLVYDQKVPGTYAKATTADPWALPMQTLHPQHGITVQREFYRGEQAV